MLSIIESKIKKSNTPTISLNLNKFFGHEQYLSKLDGLLFISNWIYLIKKFRPSYMILPFSLSSWFILALSLSYHWTKERRQQNSFSQVNILDDGLQLELVSKTEENINSTNEIGTQIWLHGFFIFRFQHMGFSIIMY